MMPKGKERSALYREVIARFDFKQSAFDRLAIACKNACWIGGHIGPAEAQAMAKRAFGAVRQYPSISEAVLDSRASAGSPRSKVRRTRRASAGVRVESNGAGCRFR